MIFPLQKTDVHDTMHTGSREEMRNREPSKEMEKSLTMHHKCDMM